MSYKLPEVALMQLKQEATEADRGTFVIEPLAPGFGLTLGNSLRRVLLSSLPGAAITSIRIDGVNHEFSTIKGVVQDVVDIILNLKQVRFKLQDDESQTVVLDAKGTKKITAADFRCPTGVSVINKNQFIAELVQGGKLLLEATVEKGRGYLPTEQRKEEKLPIGVIAIDAAFSPITRVNFQTEHTRVGKMTNYDRLIIELETDGSLTPQEAIAQSSAILVDHFSVLSGSTGTQEAVEQPAPSELKGKVAKNVAEVAKSPSLVKSKTKPKTVAKRLKPKKV